MPRPYSDDLRERVAAAVAEGRSCRAVAKLFRVSPASAVKWSQRQRTTGSAAAKPMGGVRRAVLAGQRAWLLARIKEKPDLTLHAVRAELVERGVTVSVWAVWKLFASEGITFKKKPAAIRTTARPHRAQTGPLEAHSEQDRPRPTGLHR